MTARIFRILGMLALILAAAPAQAADELFPGISNEWVLLGAVGTVVLVLFACILTLTYMLYKAVPTLLRRRAEQQA
jgi:hypothetical protein